MPAELQNLYGQDLSREQLEMLLAKREEDLASRGLAITPEIWRQAVAATEGVRFVTEEWARWTNPRTGDVISAKGSLLDVEVWAPGEELWVRALYFRRGRVSMQARGLSWSPDDPFAVAMWRLAQAAGCRIFGDEGEEVGKPG